MFTENKFSHLHNLRNYIKFFTHSLYLFLNNKNKFTRKSFCKCFASNNIFNHQIFKIPIMCLMKHPYELSLISYLARPSFDYKSLSESTKFLAENFWQILPTLPISQHSVFTTILFKIINLSYKEITWSAHAQSVSRGEIQHSTEVEGCITLAKTFIKVILWVKCIFISLLNI